MDFTKGGPQQQNIPNPGSAAPFGPSPVANAHNIKKPKRVSKLNLSSMANGIIGVVVVLLLIAIVLVIGFTKPSSQSGYVNTTKLQAVFLNTGQVYFGNVQTINPTYLVLTNIFYLQTQSGSSTTTTTSANSKVSLVKLGCELHAPYDQMVINMSAVTFWENLKPTGQVAKAVSQYYKVYPHGQACSSQGTSSTNTTGTVQNAPSSTTPPTPTAKP